MTGTGMTGTVFDVKEFSVHDGPGVRTSVFMKGCPLSCRWCHNPEGLSPKPELMVRTALCRHCGRCLFPCAHEPCKPYGRCLEACPDGLLSVCGREWEASELALRLLRGADYMRATGGGVTVTGGEPALQAEFVAELFALIKPAAVGRAVETSGFCSADRFRTLIEQADYVMMDIKLADPEAHRFYCGADNAPILANFTQLKNSGKSYLIRVPLIPGITDTRENLAAISRIVGDSPVELLGYNGFAGAKYPSVGRVYTLPDRESNKVDLSLFKNARLSG